MLSINYKRLFFGTLHYARSIKKECKNKCLLKQNLYSYRIGYLDGMGNNRTNKEYYYGN